MANENCLEGIACPKCHEEDEFAIIGSAEFMVKDDGTDQFRDVDWDDVSSIRCISCGHRGTVGTFRKEANVPEQTQVEQVEVVGSHDYEMALLSQGACNLGALVRSLAEVMKKLWAEAGRDKKGTDWVNQHPIVRLYVEQLQHLSAPCDYSKAYEVCTKKALEGKGPPKMEPQICG